MVLLPPRSKRIESLISLVVLLLLMFIGVGVFVKQFYYQPGRLGLGEAGLIGLSSHTGRSTGPAVIPSVPDGFEKLSEVVRYIYNNSGCLQKDLMKTFKLDRARLINCVNILEFYGFIRKERVGSTSKLIWLLQNKEALKQPLQNREVQKHRKWWQFWK